MAKKIIVQEAVKEQAIRILEDMLKIGFPNLESIDALKALTRELNQLTPSFNTPEQLSIARISKMVQRVEESLRHDKEISVKMYNTFNSKIVVFKTNLRLS